MKESIRMPVAPLSAAGKIRGRILVELFDANTGVKVSEHEELNMQTNLYQQDLDEFVKYGIKVSAGGLYPMAERQYSPGSGGIMLYSSLLRTSEPDYLFNDAPPAEDLVGCAVGEYVGSDTKRGTINTVESGWINEDTYRYVYDFPTHAANLALIRSISLVDDRVAETQGYSDEGATSSGYGRGGGISYSWPDWTTFFGESSYPRVNTADNGYAMHRGNITEGFFLLKQMLGVLKMIERVMYPQAIIDDIGAGGSLYDVEYRNGKLYVFYLSDGGSYKLAEMDDLAASANVTIHDLSACPYTLSTGESDMGIYLDYVYFYQSDDNYIVRYGIVDGSFTRIAIPYKGSWLAVTKYGFFMSSNGGSGYYTGQKVYVLDWDGTEKGRSQTVGSYKTVGQYGPFTPFGDDALNGYCSRYYNYYDRDGGMGYHKLSRGIFPLTRNNYTASEPKTDQHTMKITYDLTYQ